MTDPLGDWAPRGVDMSAPSPARMYDYALSGKDNFQIDRDAAEQVFDAWPEARLGVLANRGFLVSAVELCAEAGIRQFIDLGTGIPTSPNVHEVAREIQPDTRVVYVDNDPIVTAHSRALRAVDANIGVVEADIRTHRSVLDSAAVNDLIDFTEPVAVLCVAVLHFVTDEHDPAGTITAFRQRMASGSYLVLSAISTDGLTSAQIDRIHEAYDGATSRAALRTREEIAAFFDGFELVGPGLAPAARWCDDEGLETSGGALAAIGRLP